MIIAVKGKAVESERVDKNIIINTWLLRKLFLAGKAYFYKCN